MPTPDALKDALLPLTRIIASLDLRDPFTAASELQQKAPPAQLGGLRQLLLDAFAEGWLTPKRGGDQVTFGRVLKPSPETAQLSVDVVEMAGEALEHTHPRGEVSFCIAREGDPRFDGEPEGWVVLPPGSHHTPTVTGGRMLIAYFLPGGDVTWGP